MERDNEKCSDLIDLGSATIETRGLIGHAPDFANGQQGTALTED